MRNFCFDEAFGSNYIHVVMYLYYSFFNLMWLDLSFWIWQFTNTDFFLLTPRVLFVLFYYIMSHRNWLIDCFEGFDRRKVLCGISLNERKRFDLFEKDIWSHVYLSSHFKTFVVIWNNCLIFAKLCFQVIFNHV